MKPLFEDLFLIILFSVFLTCFNTAFNAQQTENQAPLPVAEANASLSVKPVIVSGHQLSVGFHPSRHPMSR